MRSTRRATLVVGAAVTLAGSAVAATPNVDARIAWANRLTWGATETTLGTDPPGPGRWLDVQLAESDTTLPPVAANIVTPMRINREPLAQMVVEEDAENRDSNALTDPDVKKTAREAYQKTMNALAEEARQRSILRDLYAPDQLREQMTWFWVNHFNVQAGKRDIRAMIGDYEQTLHDRAFGRFRDILETTLRHPAMLRYLDNDQNAAGRINENYAREIMELHSMGVGSGYSQGDVQELARILTGVGVNIKPTRRGSGRNGSLYMSELGCSSSTRHATISAISISSAARSRDRVSAKSSRHST